MIKVVSEEENIRIDKYLASILDYSREYIGKLIDHQLVLVNNRVVKASYKVSLQDEIVIHDEDMKIEEDILPVKMDLDIVYEDDYLMVLNKPSGLVVHPGNGNYNNTLVNGLMYYTKNLSNIGGEIRPGIVHRIDKDTSGLILVAKTNGVHEILADDFKNKRIKREYIALLDGVFKSASATIDAPIGRDKNNRKKMCITADNSKDAITNIKVLERYEKATLIECSLETGRTHQIRVHMAYLHHPLVGDEVYGKKDSKFKVNGQMLHAKYLGFIHPTSGKFVEFDSPLPEYFSSILMSLENREKAAN